MVAGKGRYPQGVVDRNRQLLEAVLLKLFFEVIWSPQLSSRDFDRYFPNTSSTNVDDFRFCNPGSRSQ